MFAEDKEDEIILDLVKDLSHGTFLDLGAYNGISASNTHLLAQKGWSGICVEPSPAIFPTLYENYKNNSKIILFHGAVEPSAKITPFYDAPYLSSTSVEHMKRHKLSDPTLSYKSWVTSTTSITGFFEYFPPQWFDVVSVDTESTSGQIVCALPFARMTQLRVICYEREKDPSAGTRVHSALAAQNFHLVKETKSNLIYLRQLPGHE